MDESIAALPKTWKNSFYVLFPPAFTLVCFVACPPKVTIYLSTFCLAILTLVNLGKIKNLRYELNVLWQNIGTKLGLGLMILVIKFFLVTTLILNNSCLSCLKLDFLFVSWRLLPLDFLVIVVVKPFAVDLYYNFFLFDKMKIGRYNKYFTFITRLFYQLVDFLAVFEPRENMNVYITEAFWLFYLSYIGKYHVLNSTFLRIFGALADFMVVNLILFESLGVNNNFYFVLFQF